MKVTQEKLPASQIGLEIEITSEMSKQAYEKTLKEFTRSANIPGFRKGKVPRQILIQQFGSARIKRAVIEELVETSLQQALDQEKIEALGNVELRSSVDELVAQFEPGTGFTFSATVDVSPTAHLAKYRDFTVQAEEVQYDPGQVDQVLEDYRKQTATLVPVEGRPAQPEDVAVVDFTGRLVSPDGTEGEAQEIPGGNASDFEIELVEGRFIAGFVDGIIGMTLGETKEVSVSFPEDYLQEDLAGQAAVFTITLKDLKERELPDLDDDFAQEVSRFETMTELRESLESKFQQEAEQKTKSNQEQALLNELDKQLEVECPETLIRREVDYLVTQTAMRLSDQGIDVKKALTADLVQRLREQSRPEAIARLRRTLALGEVAKQESITVARDEVNAKVREFLSTYKGDDIDLERLQSMVEEDLMQSKIFEWLAQHNTIELVPEGSLKPEETGSEEMLTEAPLAEASPVLTPSPETNPAETTVDVVAESVTDVTEEVAIAPDDGAQDPIAETTQLVNELEEPTEDSSGQSTDEAKQTTKTSKKPAKTDLGEESDLESPSPSDALEDN